MALQLDDIKYFLAVSETLNVTRASEVLGITQPTLSYSIKRLEKEVNGQLLIRLKNGVQLTHLGSEFVTKAHILMNQWNELQKISVEREEKVTGEYTIGLHPSVALFTLDQFLPKLMTENESLTLKLVHGLSREITEQVISWKIDFGIVVNPKAHPDLVIKELCRDQVGLFQKKSLPKSAKETLIYDGNLFQSKAVIKKLKIAFKKEITSENLEVIAKMTSLGIGVGLLPQRVAAAHKNLSMIKDSPTHMDRICLIYRHEKQKSFSSKTIIQTIQEGNY
ncbi:MAG: LysR family transcriptional regulator [Halobacteriovoraceae bacterium]|nr:LysR family transcriptional regulator [Halobacteriovoraceae bacterium]MBC98495.1 LysR family transcriptional regulator [Halobacteriovoraceae bacterium]|tara:strand:+ start:4064 stop:4900 length:837 start_codon:yes stop_codon:yes gene_type:complete